MKRAKPKCQGCVANAKLVISMAYKINANFEMFLLPNFATNLPDNGMVKSWPSGKANKMVPNWPSFRFRDDFMSGMRLAQVAKQRPEQK